ncbi:MAG: 2-phospho-L-lactate transferase [Solirubrobacterales bacterium]|nr:2-phospho-L-lactate transferase [Solirubrobacterales bacterium]
MVLAGGTGGAKLARGVLDLVGHDLVVIANTGDDVEIHGAHVSPDPDLVAFWLADRIDARGWGLDGDTFAVMEGLRELGADVWFNLGDRDLAVGIDRARRLAEGERLTEALAALTTALGLRARVLPMADEPVRTFVTTEERTWPFQEFMIRAGGREGDAAIRGVEFRGADRASLSPEVAEALQRARAVVVGPSNPVISIAPILAVPGMRDALRNAPAPVVAVTPLVNGRAVKGPTEAFLDWAGHGRDADGIAAAYDGLLDGLVCDGPCESLPSLRTDVDLSTPEARLRVARETLDFAAALRVKI